MAPLQSIKNVAIVGASGRVGGHFAEEVLKTGSHTVTAITRIGSKGTPPPGVKVAVVDYSSEDSLVSALKDQDFLVITLSVFTPPDTHGKLVSAASKAGVPYIMPNSYAFDYLNENVRKDDAHAADVLKRHQEISELGLTSIPMVCGFWYEWSLALGDPWFSIGIKDRKAVFFDDGKTKVNVSTWKNCGRALASLVSLPTEKVDEWKTKPLYISSFKISQRDMLDSIHRVQGTTDADWQISYEPSDERMQKGLEEMKGGDIKGFAKALYSRAFFPNGDSNFEDVRGLDNKVLGLSKEDLDEATQRAIDMVESGWSPFEEVQWKEARPEDHHP